MTNRASYKKGIRSKGVYPNTMSSSLSPSYMTMSAVKHAIATNLKSEMPGDLVTNAIALLLNTVNEWSTQIPAMLEGGGSSSSANLIFAIRKELFVAPAYTQCVLGIPITFPLRSGNSCISSRSSSRLKSLIRTLSLLR